MPTDDSTGDQSLSSSDELDNQGESGEGKETPEEKERSAQGRINELLSKNKELSEKLEKLETTPKVPAPPITPELNPAIAKVTEQIKNLGFVDESKFNQKFEELQNRIQLDNLHGQLEQKYDGTTGLPKYDRKEVEKFMQDKGVYNPEWAYEKLYPTEYLDWQLKQANKPKGPHTEIPSAPRRADDREISREKIQEWLKTPEGRIKYEQNREKILTLMQQGQL